MKILEAMLEKFGSWCVLCRTAKLRAAKMQQKINETFELVDRVAASCRRFLTTARRIDQNLGPLQLKQHREMGNRPKIPLEPHIFHHRGNPGERRSPV